MHERSVQSDFLLVILKEILQKRSDLRLVLMSATVDSDKFSAYFTHCPVLRISGRSYPVEVSVPTTPVGAELVCPPGAAPAGARGRSGTDRSVFRPGWVQTHREGRGGAWEAVPPPWLRESAPESLPRVSHV